MVGSSTVEEISIIDTWTFRWDLAGERILKSGLRLPKFYQKSNVLFFWGGMQYRYFACWFVSVLSRSWVRIQGHRM